MQRLQNKIALITGGSRGIGAKTAEVFVQSGAKVIITDILDGLGKDLANKLGENVYYYNLNVSKEEDWVKIADIIKKEFGRLDVLFNNAGITGLNNQNMYDPENSTLESWRHVHAVNLDGIFLGCKYSIPLMKQSGGSIINMASRSGKIGIPSACAYASSKAAILNYTKSVALYCAEKGYNIRCNSVSPGAILTPIWDDMLGDNKEEAIKKLAEDIPLGRMGKVEDVANTVLFLASNESDYITGADIAIDGGILAGSKSAPKGRK